MRARSLFVAYLLTGAGATACSAKSSPSASPSAPASGHDTPDAAAAGVTPDASVTPGGNDPFCDPSDCDGDGYRVPADCDDGDAKINPEAYDFIGDGVDNDCDGTIDNPIATCETTPASLPGSPTDFARAADLCAQRAKTNAGVVFDPLLRAAWGQVQGDGPGSQQFISQTKPQQVSIVSSYGQNAVRTGQTMIGLANGIWGTLDPRSDPALDPAGFHLNDACADIPLTGLDCQSLTDGSPAGGTSVQDWAELTLWIKVPSNAGSMAFDFAFFSSEFNQFWNASLNDAFFVLVSNSQISGSNVAKDAHGLGITVNSGFFQVCPESPGPAGLSQDKAAALQQCVGVAGSATQSIAGALAGTGYDGATATPTTANDTVTSTEGNLYVYGGGSGWLSAAFPVTPREQMQVRIVVMDTFDGLKDSAVIVDGLRWQPTAASGVTRPPIK